MAIATPQRPLKMLKNWKKWRGGGSAHRRSSRSVNLHKIMQNHAMRLVFVVCLRSWVRFVLWMDGIACRFRSSGMWPWMRMKMGLPIRMRIGSSSEFACLPAATCCRCCTLMKFVSITTFMPVACQVRFCFSTWFWFSALRAVSCVICITIQISAHVYEAFMMRLFHFGQYLDLTIETNSMVKANKYKYIHYNIEGCDEIKIFCSFAGSKFINPSSIPSYPAIILKDRSLTIAIWELPPVPLSLGGFLLQSNCSTKAVSIKVFFVHNVSARRI